MDKPIAAIELGSKKLKLVVGYEIDGKVYVLYTLVKPYGHAIEAGVFTDPNRVSQTINSVREFTDPSAKLKLNIADVALCLPPYGLGIYQTRQVTTVVTEDIAGSLEAPPLALIFKFSFSFFSSSSNSAKRLSIR